VSPPLVDRKVSLPPPPVPPYDDSVVRSVVALPLFCERAESCEKLVTLVFALEGEPRKTGERGEDFVEEPTDVFEAFRPCRWETARSGRGRDRKEGSAGRLIGFVEGTGVRATGVTSAELAVEPWVLDAFDLVLLRLDELGDRRGGGAGASRKLSGAGCEKAISV
jgi:hypothetical protein